MPTILVLLPANLFAVGHYPMAHTLPTYREYIDANVYSGNEHLFQRFQTGQIIRNTAKIQLILSRIEERLIPSLLIILIMAALANPVCPWHHVKPPLFAAHAISHLLGGKCLVEFPLDGKVFFVEGRLLVVTCKPGRRLVEFARCAFFRKGLPTGPADRVSCKTRASTGTAASRRGGRGWWPSSGEHRADAREPR